MADLQSDFGLPPAIAAELALMGAKLDGELIERSRALFAELQDETLLAGTKRHDDVPYGDDPRQTLDICAPEGEGLPIVLFVPGGGFVGGDKRFYRHVPAFFARAGFVAASVNYRLAPGCVWPTGGTDVSRALDWLADNAAQFGGDATRIFVVGQSAGGCHAGTMLFHPEAEPRCMSSIRAAVLMSGVHEVLPNTAVMNATIYFGEDPDLYPYRSNVTHVSRSKLPVIVTLAEFDPDYLVQSATALIDALTERDGRSPPVVWLKGHNHLSPVLGLGSSVDTLGPAIADEFRRYLA